MNSIKIYLSCAKSNTDKKDGWKLQCLLRILIFKVKMVDCFGSYEIGTIYFLIILRDINARTNQGLIVFHLS